MGVDCVAWCEIFVNIIRFSHAISGLCSGTCFLYVMRLMLLGFRYGPESAAGLLVVHYAACRTIDRHTTILTQDQGKIAVPSVHDQHSDWSFGTRARAILQL